MSLDRLTRYSDRGSNDREELNRLLDEQLVATVSTVVDGEPWSIPTFYVRDGDRILIHGSTGAGLLRHIANGAAITFAVHSLDAIVVAYSAFESSANYRSAVIRGSARKVSNDDAVWALDILTNGLIPGRMEEVHAHRRKELAATTVLELPIENFIFKSRTGPAGEPEEPTSNWFGILPLMTRAGAPEPDPGCQAEVPKSVHNLVDRLNGA